MEKEVKIYTNKDCIYCNELKNGLNAIKLKYVDVDVDAEINSAEVRKIYDLAGEAVIPIIAIRPSLLVPKKSFNTIDEALELIKVLME